MADETPTDDTAANGNAIDPTATPYRWCEHAAPGKNCCGNRAWCAQQSARRQLAGRTKSAKARKSSDASRRRSNLRRGKRHKGN